MKTNDSDISIDPLSEISVRSPLALRMQAITGCNINLACKPNFVSKQIKESITAVSKSYNIPDLKDGFRNQLIEKFYYIEYWANKKNIPVNFNEKNLEKRSLFNLDTIILSILSDKLKILNEYESSKPKK